MFISIEGTEGVGKSTLITGIEAYLIKLGYQVQISREPGGTPVAEKIREILINPNVSEQIAPETELLLLYAARMQNAINNILPALRENQHILVDRYHDASYAYQVASRGVSKSDYDSINERFLLAIPDLTLWLDMPVEVGLQRAKKRGELDRFEKEKVSFFEKVHEGYAFLHRTQSGRIKRINAHQSSEAVLHDAIIIIQQALANKTTPEKGE